MQYSCVFLGRSFLYSFQLLILMESTWTVPHYLADPHFRPLHQSTLVANLQRK